MMAYQTIGEQAHTLDNPWSTFGALSNVLTSNSVINLKVPYLPCNINKQNIRIQVVCIVKI